jgi:hypothetical protein
LQWNLIQKPVQEPLNQDSTDTNEYPFQDQFKKLFVVNSIAQCTFYVVDTHIIVYIILCVEIKLNENLV